MFETRYKFSWYGQDTSMRYVGVLVVSGLVSSLVGLSLAKAAITLPQSVQISAQSRISQPRRTKKLKRLKPVPTIASANLEKIDAFYELSLATSTSTPTPTTLPTPEPSPIPAPTPTIMPTPAPAESSSGESAQVQIKPTSPSIKIIDSGGSSNRQPLQDATNAYRENSGKNALSFRDDLCSLATTRAKEIANSFDHGGFRSRIDSGEMKSLNYKGVAENIWHGQGDAGRIVKDWSESEGHNRNLLEDWQWGCGAEIDGYAAYLYLR